MPALRWDLFCHVVDNFGDVGVCWRLAAQLGARGDRVRLLIDDASALAWMAPQGAPGVEILRWTDAGGLPPADVVVEAFGCDPPPAFVAAMTGADAPPVWINLEYLSAEDYVERSHGLPSPQACGLTKWFFFPGFTPRTGGLLREDGLLEARAAFDRDAWLRSIGVERQPGERVVSLFSYRNPHLPELLRDLAAAPTLLLLARGPAQEQVAQVSQAAAQAAPAAGLRLHGLPWLDQPGFDRLLWSADLNFVRGEDSLVRALWAGVPFVWMAYPQHDDAHRAKLEALLARAALPPDAALLLRAWNGFAPWPPTSVLPDLAPEGRWAAALRRWRAAVGSQDDLATQLRSFALARRAADRPPGEPGPAC
jgi:uncharacterized repeat protein (TIGR03837 family)